MVLSANFKRDNAQKKSNYPSKMNYLFQNKFFILKQTNKLNLTITNLYKLTTTKWINIYVNNLNLNVYVPQRTNLMSLNSNFEVIFYSIFFKYLI